MQVAMPLLSVAESLFSLLEKPATLETDRAWSLEVLCRLASRRRNTMQTTPQFFAANSRWLRKLDVRALGRRAELRVNHAALTQDALDVWSAMSGTDRDAAIAAARQVLEADIESAGHLCAVLPPMPAHDPVAAPVDAQQELAASLVALIHAAELQPTYRKKPFGAPIRGWPARLHGYFWPAPAHGYAHVTAGLEKLLAEAEVLALAAPHCWDAPLQKRAVSFAQAVFAWGSVPQDEETVTAAYILQVFLAALENNPLASAPMNSGWTKVAAFATAHLERTGLPHVIWDSRVATAIIHRIEQTLAEDVDPASVAPAIGTVPGRGGSRPRPLKLRWRGGYQRWDTQVAGSALVRRMRDVLNDPSFGYPAMPLPDGGTGPWTTRGVEMVLFMDGY